MTPDVQPIPKLEPRKKTRRQIPEKVKRQVRERSGGRCEFTPLCGGRCRVEAHQMHHRRRKSQGGTDTAENLAHLCSACHSWVHANVAVAIELGLIITASSGPEPESSAVVRVEKVQR